MPWEHEIRWFKSTRPNWACDLTAKVRDLGLRYGGSNPLRPTLCHVTQLAEVSGLRPESCGFDSRRGYGHVGQLVESFVSNAKSGGSNPLVPTWADRLMAGQRAVTPPIVIQVHVSPPWASRPVERISLSKSEDAGSTPAWPAWRKNV